MRTKILKIGMPVLVFVAATVFAFATDKTSPNNEPLTIQGYVFKDGMCQISRLCDNIGGLVCQDSDGLTVYGEETITCSDQLFQRAE